METHGSKIALIRPNTQGIVGSSMTKPSQIRLAYSKKAQTSDESMAKPPVAPKSAWLTSLMKSPKSWAKADFIDRLTKMRDEAGDESLTYRDETAGEISVLLTAVLERISGRNQSPEAKTAGDSMVEAAKAMVLAGRKFILGLDEEVKAYFFVEAIEKMLRRPTDDEVAANRVGDSTPEIDEFVRWCGILRRQVADMAIAGMRHLWFWSILDNETTSRLELAISGNLDHGLKKYVMASAAAEPAETASKSSKPGRVREETELRARARKVAAGVYRIGLRIRGKTPEEIDRDVDLLFSSQAILAVENRVATRIRRAVGKVAAVPQEKKES